ncbi:hypothetical protein HUT16_03670 [Kitasatospora sp. NA04385]|uniref:hypothetical protein n=1 Tax=Kitasatospora sp. NA04385 TaxID=2742135 RepID=UPI001591C11E|nr:hypothetical protein [Kitasatospora sp. NA04385]QKW18283.1 hypothetical protein HUT16_03670 [Kitasatospora sp. NA04385]
MNTGRSGDDLWEEFVKEYEKDNAVREPSAAERAEQAGARRPGPRRSRRRLLLPLSVALLVVAGTAAYAYDTVRSTPPTAPPAAASPARPGSSASPGSSAAPADPAGLSDAAPTAAAPLSVFPERVQGYTLVKKVANPVCTGADTVAPTLAGLIAQGKGCLGVDLAMYRDAAGNEYNLVLFTMKDADDAKQLLLWLGDHIGTYPVVVQLPPDDSGLRQLPADSGLVESYAAQGNYLLAGMAQWADGHTGNFNDLVARLTPLIDSTAHGLYPG